ncbi:transporter substrate-binding domain-containing protein [Fibrobacterota bacterium]
MNFSNQYSGFRLVAAFLIFSWLLSCSEREPYQPPPQGQIKFDLLEIQRKGKLTALCRYDPSSYFIYKGQPMGYEYDLLNRLAEHLMVELEVKVPRTWEELYEMLHTGEGDIVAASMKVTLEGTEKVAFTDNHSTTRQMLIQRKPEGWRKLKRHQIDKRVVRSPLQLVDKEIHVQQKSSYNRRLVNLSQEIGGRIKIAKVSEEMETAFLIKMVAEGTIDYTVADENLVRGYETYYTNLDAKTPLSFPQKIAWAVRKNSPQLLEEINEWLRNIKTGKDPTFNVIYSKYFKSSRAFARRMSSDYLSINGGKLSPYDSLFKLYSKDLGWDWKLLASVAFQESKFDSRAVSWAGAVGVMQLLPSTAEELGIKHPKNPRESIKAGVKLLKLLYAYWKNVPDPGEQLKFTLASYNAGKGHIEDARRLAEKFGKDPDIWADNVAEYLLKKSERKYFYDNVVRYGYCRGEEPYNYVKEILERYKIYQQYEEYLENGTTSGVDLLSYKKQL